MKKLFTDIRLYLAAFAFATVSLTPAENLFPADNFPKKIDYDRNNDSDRNRLDIVQATK